MTQNAEILKKLENSQPKKPKRSKSGPTPTPKTKNHENSKQSEDKKGKKQMRDALNENYRLPDFNTESLQLLETSVEKIISAEVKLAAEAQKLQDLKNSLIRDSCATRK